MAKASDLSAICGENKGTPSFINFIDPYDRVSTSVPVRFGRLHDLDRICLVPACCCAPQGAHSGATFPPANGVDVPRSRGGALLRSESAETIPARFFLLISLGSSSRMKEQTLWFWNKRERDREMFRCYSRTQKNPLPRYWRIFYCLPALSGSGVDFFSGTDAMRFFPVGNRRSFRAHRS